MYGGRGPEYGPSRSMRPAAFFAPRPNRVKASKFAFEPFRVVHCLAARVSVSRTCLSACVALLLCLCYLCGSDKASPCPPFLPPPLPMSPCLAHEACTSAGWLVSRLTAVSTCVPITYTEHNTSPTQGTPTVGLIMVPDPMTIVCFDSGLGNMHPLLFWLFPASSPVRV